MDNWHAETANFVVKRVDRRHQLSGSRGRAWAIGRIGQMTLMHIDRNHGATRAIVIGFEPSRQGSSFAVDVSVHANQKVARDLSADADRNLSSTLSNAKAERARALSNLLRKSHKFGGLKASQCAAV